MSPLGLLDRLIDLLFPETHVIGADGTRILDIPSGMNVRELGGYALPDGSLTRPHRFVRCGSTRYMNRRDADRLRDYGVTHVLDLRGDAESPRDTCYFAHRRDVTWLNVPLFGRDISDPRLAPRDFGRNYLIPSYLDMLGNHEGIRRCFAFFAEAPEDSCILFHCAAGMDRTGMTAMLILGLAGVSRTDIVKDYLYSFGSIKEVERAVDLGEYAPTDQGMRMPRRREAIEAVYDSVVEGYGSVEAYLRACGLTDDELRRVRQRLIG